MGEEGESKGFWVIGGGANRQKKAEILEAAWIQLLPAEQGFNEASVTYKASQAAFIAAKAELERVNESTGWGIRSTKRDLDKAKGQRDQISYRPTLKDILSEESQRLFMEVSLLNDKINSLIAERHNLYGERSAVREKHDSAFAELRIAQASLIEAEKVLDEAKGALQSIVLDIARVPPMHHGSADVVYTEPDKDIDVLFGHDDVLSVYYEHCVVHPDGTVSPKSSSGCA